MIRQIYSVIRISYQPRTFLSIINSVKTIKMRPQDRKISYIELKGKSLTLEYFEQTDKDECLCLLMRLLPFLGFSTGPIDLLGLDLRFPISPITGKVFLY